MAENMWRILIMAAKVRGAGENVQKWRGEGRRFVIVYWLWHWRCEQINFPRWLRPCTMARPAPYEYEFGGHPPAGRICLSPIQLRGYESTVANRQWLMKAVDSGFCQCSYCFRGIWNSCTRARSYTALYSLSSLFILLHYTFAAEVTFSLHRLSVSKKGKVLPYSLPSVGPGADPGVQAVSPQVTWSYPSGGRLPLLSARPAVTFPTKERHRSSAGTKLYCLVTEVQACEQLAQGCYLEANLPRFEPKTFRITSKRSTVKPHRPHSLLVNNTKSCGWMFTKCRNLVEHGHTRIECVLEVFQNILWIS